MATANINLVTDLQEPIKVVYLPGNLFSQDSQANKINVTVLDGGEPATISGSISANIIRSDGGTVAATGGEIVGNVVSITLPAAAYLVPGVISVAVKVTSSSIVTTIAAFVATMYRSSTDTVIDPGTIIPSIQNLITQIETAVASIPADYSSLWTTLAPAYTQKAYSVGQYCSNGGVVYRCISEITTGEYFTPAHWTAANIGDDLSSLKSALTLVSDVAFVQFGETANLSNWEQGYIRDDGSLGSATKHCRTNLKHFTSCEYARFTPKSGYILSVAKYASSDPNSFVKFIEKNTTVTTYIDVSTGYFCFDVAKEDNTVITPEGLPSDVVTWDKLMSPHDELHDELQELLQNQLTSPWNDYSWEKGYINLGNGEVSDSSTRVCTTGYINEQIQKIIAAIGFYFRVSAYESDGTYIGTFTTNDVFGKSGSSKNLTEFSFTKYSYSKYKLTVLKTNNGNISPSEASHSIYQTVFNITDPVKNTIDSISANNLCLIGIRTALVNSKIPYHEGFLFHKFVETENGRELFYGASFDKLQSIGDFVGASPFNRNFAISPKDGSIIYVVSENGTTQVRVAKDRNYYDTGFEVLASWLYNSGCDFIKDENNVEYCVFAEYGGNPDGPLHVYRGTYPYTSANDWETVMTVIGEQDIHHFHQVRRDPWTNILYLTSGDENNLTHWWYSEDCGATWTELIDGADVVTTWGTMACRTINFIFTKNYIYWATDSYQNHMLCRIQRNSSTGVIDLSTFEKLATLKPGCATNSLCYSEAPYGLFMYERVDSGATAYYGTPVTMQFYNLETNQLDDVITLGLTEDTWGGSRGKCYVNYTNPNQPFPAMGFDGNTPCIFDIVYDDPQKIGTIVYDINGKIVKDVLL